MAKSYEINKEIKTEPITITVLPMTVLDYKEHLEDRKEATEYNINYWEGQLSTAALYGAKEITVPVDIMKEIIKRMENRFLGMIPKEDVKDVSKEFKDNKNTWGDSTSSW